MGTPVRLVAVGLAASAAALLPTPAQAEESDDFLGLSADGITWSGTLEDPLFDPNVRWVPGDVRTARFFVRNQQPDAGDLAVFVDRVVRRDLADTGQLAISARAGTQSWVTVTGGGRQQLVDRDRLRPAVPLEIMVRVALVAGAPNQTMVLGTDLDFTVTLTDSDAVLDSGGDGADGVDEGDGAVIDLGGNGSPSPGGQPAAGGLVAGAGGVATPVAAANSDDFLPGTGSAIPPWLPPAGLLMLGTGTYLVLRRRKQDEAPEPTLH